MRDHHRDPPSVVVGIDGSRPALDAALWAVDESVSRDIPLRLVYAIDSSSEADTDPQQAARDLAAAEVAVRYAFTVVESTHKPVKVEVEILQARPVRALLQASRGAVMLCVGSMGLTSSSRGQVGSTAAALAASAHCPVAIVQGFDPHARGTRWIVAEVDGSSTSDGILQRGLEEAQLRGAPLRVLTTWQSRFTDIHDSRAINDGNRLAKAGLERRLASWKRRHPDVDIKATAVHGNVVNYLARNADSIQLFVAGHERAHGIRELVGPPGYAALHQAGCSVLVCESQTLL